MELVDANHQAVDKGTIEFEVPKRAAATIPSEYVNPVAADAGTNITV